MQRETRKTKMRSPDLNLPQSRLVVLLEIDVDGKMRVDVSHLVLETLGDAYDQVEYDGSDGAESSDALARAMVKLDVDDILLWLGKADR